MIPVMQRIKHDPENGAYGDCHRAALASVLELDYNEVPHFCDEASYAEGGESWTYRERLWLVEHGHVPVIMLFDGELENVLHAMAINNPNVYYILGGKSKMGSGHSVVGCNDEIVHDPSPLKTGIVGPLRDGYYCITVFCSIVTSRYGESCANRA